MKKRISSRPQWHKSRFAQILANLNTIVSPVTANCILVDMFQLMTAISYACHAYDPKQTRACCRSGAHPVRP